MKTLTKSEFSCVHTAEGAVTYYQRHVEMIRVSPPLFIVAKDSIICTEGAIISEQKV